MNRSSALTIFNLASDSVDSEEIRDAYEQAVFEISNRFLRNHPQPFLVRAKIKRLQTFSEAWLVLTGQSPGMVGTNRPKPRTITGSSRTEAGFGWTGTFVA